MMARYKITQEYFLKMAEEVHGDRYDYKLTHVSGGGTKVDIICKVHGVFKQSPSTHLSGSGCRKCGCAFTKEEFISRSKIVHNNKYAYHNVVYFDSKSKVSISCLDHGDFLQTPRNHLRGDGCRKCATMRNSKTRKENTKDSFIESAVKIHGGKYSYSKVEYDGRRSPVIITCSVHGDFKQTPNTHLTGSGENVLEAERHIKRNFANSGVFIEGFKTEAFTEDRLQPVLEYLRSNSNLL